VVEVVAARPGSRAQCLFHLPQDTNARLPPLSARGIRNRCFVAYIGGMPGKPLELPIAIAKAFLRDMRAFHAEKSPLKRDEIASRQIHVLRQYQGQHERPIKLHQVKQMFKEMRDQ
jgi:hypothetical protein